MDELQRDHTGLLQCLTITTGIWPGEWTFKDVLTNLHGGIFTLERGHEHFRDIEAALCRERFYEVPDQTAPTLESIALDLWHARTFGGLDNFNIMFAPASRLNPPTVKSGIEFATFYQVIFNFHQINEKAKNMSFVHKKNMVAYYIAHQAFSFQYDQTPPFKYDWAIGWDIPLLLHSDAMQDDLKWHTFLPQNGWGVFSPKFRVPLVISDFVSKRPYESNRNRLLIEAIAAARAGWHLLQETSRSGFCVVAIYVDATFVASRYLVKQINDERQVSICREDFDLADTRQSILFLQEMFNLASHLEMLSDKWDEEKGNVLARFQAIAHRLPSLPRSEEGSGSDSGFDV